MSHITKKATWILVLLIIIGAVLRFYDLNWGAPYYFHPDERNIANSVTQLSFPSQLNPKFFAYGSLPIYAIYATGLSGHFFHNIFVSTLSFTEAIVISRIFSAILSLLLIPLIYLAGKELCNKTTGVIASTITTFSIGFIQFAHFGTFEMWLTFWTTVLFYSCLRYYTTKKTSWILAIGLIFGILCAIKVSSVALAPLIVFALFLDSRQVRKEHAVKNLRNLVLVGLVASGVYVLTNPFVIVDFQSFLGSMRYESGVATGSLSVFYTEEFVNSIPIFYPLTSIFPFLLNPLTTIVFIPAFCYVLFEVYRTKNKKYILLVAFFLILFFSQTFLYVQWTRYYVPTIPFILLMIALSIDALFKTTYKKIGITILGILITYTLIYAAAFTITTYYEVDTRLQALHFAKQHIQPTEEIVSETYDLGIIPFNESFRLLSLYDFYALDAPNTTTEPIPTHASYVILPSQRLIKVRTQNPKVYPKGNAFYSALANGRLGFKKIYQTPCDIWCQIVYFNNPMNAFEGTASVFDRPVVMIFQKQ